MESSDSPTITFEENKILEEYMKSIKIENRNVFHRLVHRYNIHGAYFQELSKEELDFINNKDKKIESIIRKILDNAEYSFNKHNSSKKSSYVCKEIEKNLGKSSKELACVDDIDIKTILEMYPGIWRESPTKNTIMSCISDSLKSHFPFDNRNLDDTTKDDTTKDDTNKDDTTKIDFFNQKKHFADETTKAMSNGFLFKNEEQTVIFEFQKLVNNMFNEKITEYKKHYGLDDDSIYFIYKGGSAMKMIFEKYKKQLLNNPNLTNFNDYFERSDADYSIYIDKTLGKDTYNQIFCDMNKITYYILTNIQQLLSNDLERYCPINNVTSEQLEQLLQNCNETLEKKKNDMPDISSVIRDFIGIGFDDKQIFPKGRIPRLNESLVHSFKQADDRDYDLSDSPAIKSKKLKSFMERGKIPVTRDNFIIKVDSTTKPYSFPAICYLEGDLNTNGIYYSFNETNRFIRDNTKAGPNLDEQKITEFNLHRLKINTILYYSTRDGKFGFLSCPSELIDVSISSYINWNSQGLNFEKMILQYNYRDSFNFYSYSLYGFLDDLMKGIFEDTTYPWDIGIKYKKKVKRLLVLLFIYIYENFNNVKITCRYIKVLFASQNFIRSFPLIKKDKTKINSVDDEILLKLFTYMEKLHSKILIGSNLYMKFYEFRNYFSEIWNFTDDDSPVELLPNQLKELNKYLKYKSKYLALKKQTNK